MKIEIDKNAEFIIKKLNSRGFSAYAVGGAVRDFLLSREVFDTDITTDATPDEIKSVFSSFRTADTGIKHGTVTVIKDLKPYEITTFRSESGYRDSRHPDRVVFETDIKKDLSRRDFTVNAMAYSDETGIIDPFFGQEDLKNRIIRTVGDADKRFSEDALRILRGLRFASELGFSVEEKTYKAMKNNVEKISLLSKERVYTEISKMLTGRYACRTVTLYKDLIKKIMPLSDNIKSLDRLPYDKGMRFACACGKKAEEFLVSLKADTKTKTHAKMFSEDTEIFSDIYKAKKFVSEKGRENAEDIALYRKTVFNENTEILKLASETSDCVSIKELDINGDDLKKIGITGKRTGDILYALLNDVIFGKTENRKEVLLNRAKVIDKTDIV